MAGKTIPYGHALAETQIRQGLVLENERVTRAFALKARDEEAAIVELDMDGHDRGSTAEIRFRAIAKDRIPKTDPAQIVGTEPERTEYTDILNIRYFIPSTGAVTNPYADQQNVSFDLESNEQLSMAAETGEWFERGIMNTLSGNTSVNNTTTYPDYGWSCGNAAINPDAAHHFFAPDASGANTTEAQVAADSGSLLTDRFVNKVITNLRSRRNVAWPLAPASTPWGKRIICLASGEALNQVRENSSDSDFYDLTKAEIMGGVNPELTALLTGEGFISLGGVLYLETDYWCFGLSGVAAGATTQGTLQDNCARAVILGARAAHLGWGMGFTGGLHLGYTEHNVHGRKSMAIHTNFGCKAVVVNGQRWGSAVISHYTEKTASQ